MISGIDTTLTLKVTSQHEIRKDVIDEIINILVKEKMSISEIYNTLNDVLEKIIQEKTVS